MARVRHIPIRSCIVCRARRPKGELLRIVRTPEGRVMLDTTGRIYGRGAYLCNDPACWRRALKGNRLEQALRGPIPPEDRAVLEPLLSQEDKR